MKKALIPFLLAAGVLTLAGCSNYGDKDTAISAAKKFLSEDLNTSTVLTKTPLKLKDVKATYYKASKQWDIEGTADYQSEDNGYLWTETTFEIVVSTKDNKLWSADSTSIDN